ncbi:MAG TPA: aspartyl protease family protein [Candidatus Saccharimonadia bacterium]|nr:aspartyl protease family protein [Candidatus Saccharimonadia bacterium]
MRIKYTALDGEVKRPYADIEVSHGEASESYLVLVDSGADINIFSAEIGRALGIDIASGEPLSVRGATGDEQTFYLHPITITIGNITFDTTAAFADVRHLEAAGLAGQLGFFDRFLVAFDAEANEFELKPKG